MKSWRGVRLAAVLFDLDGTLVDTAADIALALNLAFADHGLLQLDVSQVRMMVGRGSPMLIERAAASQNVVFDEGQRSALLERFFHHYGELEHSGQSTARAYEGAGDVLRALKDDGIKIAVVTNKHKRFADVLMDQLGFSRWIDLVVGGDTCARRKPDPEPLLFACGSLGVDSGNALMVGDSINDVQAARAANMPIVCVSYGYNEGRDPRTLDCDVLIDSLRELMPLLDGA